MTIQNPNEQEILAGIAKAQAAGQDPFGDDDEDEAPETIETAEVVEAAGEGPAEVDADPDKGAELPGQAADEEAPEQAERPHSYKADLPSDYADQRKTLMLEKAQAMKQLMEGELDADAFAEIEARVSNALEDLTATRIRAETLLEANAQNQANAQQSEIRKLIARAKSEVDYLAEPKAQKQFDLALRSLQGDSDNADKGFDELVSEAHKVVLALRGVSSKSEQVAQAVISKARKVEAGPVTLRSLPAAATPNSNGDVFEQMSRLKGEAYQQAFDKLTPQQRKAILDED